MHCLHATVTIDEYATRRVRKEVALVLEELVGGKLVMDGEKDDGEVQ